MNLLELLSKYKDEYIEIKTHANLSHNTISSLHRILDRFYDFVADESAEQELSLNDINRYFIYNYLSHLKSKFNVSANSQKTYLIHILNFLRYIADDDIKKYGFIHDNIRNISIKTEQKAREFFSENDYKRIVSLLNKYDASKSYLNQRNSMIIKLLMYCGLRISELISLKWTDINEIDTESHGTIYKILVKGKGNKERTTYISHNEINHNYEFLKKHAETEYVFTTTKQVQCRRENLYIYIKRILAKVGVTNFDGLHQFRRTLAMKMVEENKNLSTIKAVLGHSSIATTEKYYAKSSENAKRDALLKKK